MGALVKKVDDFVYIVFTTETKEYIFKINVKTKLGALFENRQVRYLFDAHDFEKYFDVDELSDDSLNELISLARNNAVLW